MSRFSLKVTRVFIWCKRIITHDSQCYSRRINKHWYQRGPLWMIAIRSFWDIVYTMFETVSYHFHFYCIENTTKISCSDKFRNPTWHNSTNDVGFNKHFSVCVCVCVCLYICIYIYIYIYNVHLLLSSITFSVLSLLPSDRRCIAWL